MTMVTVKLFKIADRKNVRNPITQKRDFLDFVVIKLVTTYVYKRKDGRKRGKEGERKLETRT
jgi:hypothetical protein